MIFKIQYYHEWQESKSDDEHNEKVGRLDKLQEQHILASIGLAKVSKNLPLHIFHLMV